jgi:hypothetical protein
LMFVEPIKHCQVCKIWEGRMKERERNSWRWIRWVEKEACARLKGSATCVWRKAIVQKPMLSHHLVMVKFASKLLQKIAN